MTTKMRNKNDLYIKIIVINGLIFRVDSVLENKDTLYFARNETLRSLSICTTELQDYSNVNLTSNMRKHK